MLAVLSVQLRFSTKPAAARYGFRMNNHHRTKNMTTVLMTTNKGNIKVELDADKAPKTVANFLDYVNKGHFSNTIFHRVIKDFMIQGGGFEPGMKQKPTEQTVENEAKNGLKNDKYTVAMARTMAPHSASAQFFINTKNNDFLNYPGQDGWGYAVFGKVVEGQDVVDQINNVKTSRAGMHSDVPSEDVIIEKVEVVQ
jgi:peptidyl-prolyl cis-trans isomerase B (cyclophilin B)